MLKVAVFQLDRLVATVLVGAISFYQLAMSPWLGRNCRFLPTCSHYAREAIQLHGSLPGVLLAGARICRCHPLGRGGYDPVPAQLRLSDLFPFLRSSPPDGSQT